MGLFCVTNVGFLRICDPASFYTLSKGGGGGGGGGGGILKSPPGHCPEGIT